ncbi:hypothetical protein [Chryseobacterium indologenes]|uniref:hypothetical protein n=1 Tax=Chryseobacterium indologenes TaxID=253 RepID=UPI0007892B32|nr:hypothetical protein [Chryseobacterium indologenes]
MNIRINSIQQDYSTNDVLDWIYFEYPSAACVRSEDLEVESMLISNHADPAGNDAYWYRRGYLKDHGYHPGSVLDQYDRQSFRNIFLNVYDKYNFEEKVIHEAYIDWYDKLFKKRLNKRSDNNINKLKALHKAKEAGLLIPETLVSSNISAIENFYRSHEKIIVKDVMLDDIKVNWNEDFDVVVRIPPTIVTESHIQQLKEIRSNISQGYIFLQKYIEKEYELRIFYLDGKLYPMAIFSQANERTKVDFRNYDAERPNRCIPYRLPLKETRKLIKLMKCLDLNCASIDMIYTVHKEYVFLEANPVGQFQWLSDNCNYDIERSIARFLNQ